MRALIQRVRRATVTINDATSKTFDGIIDGQPARTIDKGFVILLAVGSKDTEDQARKLWSKISKLRIFDDGSGKSNLALADVQGQVMIISQFTLYADCKKGNRPSYTNAAPPDAAKQLYRSFVRLALDDIDHVAVGEFGAHMSIDLENDGPFTIWLDTDEL